ncbi:hypothetical protein AVEN_92783-1 [Araneus ventricosus]|uniref:RNase H type-1 domain-containing protein n=1 Tax=Araneus ventricosus TaxID=182803 RepID=A0A4Y2HIF7_ARAVE|nr:hypothetical protein AVEN_92783-1 [Araneus ventricosus]
MVTSKLALTCCKLVSSLHSCHVKFAVSLKICSASLLQTKIGIWTRLSLRNTVFQAEILAFVHAVALPSQQLTILVDNQASIKPKESQFNCPENLQVTP